MLSKAEFVSFNEFRLFTFFLKLPFLNHTDIICLGIMHHKNESIEDTYSFRDHAITHDDAFNHALSTALLIVYQLVFTAVPERVRLHTPAVDLIEMRHHGQLHTIHMYQRVS